MKNSNFQFIGYRISKIDCNIDDAFGQNAENINYDINIENNFDKDNPRIVEVALNVTASSDTGNFHFFLKIKGGFKADSDMKDDVFKKLAKQNAPAILFPFARSIITSYTAQANIPPIILPTVNFIEGS